MEVRYHIFYDKNEEPKTLPCDTASMNEWIDQQHFFFLFLFVFLVDFNVAHYLYDTIKQQHANQHTASMSSLLVRHGRWGPTGTCFNHCWTQSELLGTRTLPMVWHRIMPHRCTERRKRKKQKMTFFFPIFCTQHGQPFLMIQRNCQRVEINICDHDKSYETTTSWGW